jgi:hypothetical protein
MMCLSAWRHRHFLSRSHDHLSGIIRPPPVVHRCDAIFARKTQQYRKVANVNGIPVNMTNITSADQEDSLWKKFEFSESPKLDARFGKVIFNNTNQTELSKEKLLVELHQQESVFDREYAASVRRQNSAWTNLDPRTVQEAIACIQPYIQADRIQKIENVLRRRTKNVRFLFESAWAHMVSICV